MWFSSDSQPLVGFPKRILPLCGLWKQFCFLAMSLPTEIVIRFMNLLIMQCIIYDKNPKFLATLDEQIFILNNLNLILRNSALLSSFYAQSVTYHLNYWQILKQVFHSFFLSTAQLPQSCISLSHLFLKHETGSSFDACLFFKGCFSTFVFWVKFEMIWKVLLSDLVFYFTHLFLVGIQPLNCQFVNTFGCLIVWPYIYKKDPNRYFLLCFTDKVENN